MITNFLYFSSRLFKSEVTFLSIPLLSLGLGTTLLFSSFCIFYGLHQDFYRQIEKIQPHYTLRPLEGYFFYDSEAKQSLLRKLIPHAKVSAALISQGLIHIGDRASGILLRGDESIEGNQTDIPLVQISKSLAQDLQIDINQSAELILADGSHHDIIISEVFNDFEFIELKHTVKMSLATCQRLLFEDQMVNRFEIQFPKLLDQDNEGFINKLNSEIESLKITSWRETYSETLLLFNVEEKLHLAFLLLFSIFLFVSTYASFTLVFLRKRNSIKSLRTLGWTKAQEIFFLAILSHFLILFALLAGIAMSALVKLGLLSFPLELPQSLFYSKTVPFNWQWTFLVGVVSVIYLTCILSIFLAWRKVFTK